MLYTSRYWLWTGCYTFYHDNRATFPQEALPGHQCSYRWNRSRHHRIPICHQAPVRVLRLERNTSHLGWICLEPLCLWSLDVPCPFIQTSETHAPTVLYTT